MITLHELPAFEPVVQVDGKMLPPTRGDVLRWGDKSLPTPPAIGDVVHCTVNSIGPVEITGYFADGGFLGCYGLALAPPLWFTKQNGPHNRQVGLFGSEMCSPAQWEQRVTDHKAREKANG